MKRVIAPEWLDELDPADSAATASRRDLWRLNHWMGHANLIAQTLQDLFPTTPPRRLAELGCGDGTLMLHVAQSLCWQNVHLSLIDLHPVISSQTLRVYSVLNWQVEPVVADVTEWLPRQGGFDAVIANLFLHHLENAKLRCLFSAAARASTSFVACEPRRSHWRDLASRGLWFLGANAITQHDAPISVRAGFSGRELSSRWPHPGWTTHEHRAGLFSHLFIAQKQQP